MSGEHGYWTRFVAGNVVYGVVPTQWYHGYNYPIGTVGFGDQNGHTTTSTTLTSGTNGATVDLSAGASHLTDGTIGFGLTNPANAAFATYDHPAGAISIGWYLGYASDDVAPQPTVAGNDGWLTSNSTVAARATDNGMGVRFLSLQKADGTTLGTGVELPCPAVGLQICPFDTGTKNLPVSGAPEGISTQYVAATDAAGSGNASGGTTKRIPFQLKFDSTPPAHRLSGTLYGRVGSVATEATYALTIQAADTGSGVASTQVLVDGVVVDQASAPPCTAPQGGCSFDRTWTLQQAQFPPGMHRITVLSTDRVGLQDETNFAVKLDPRGSPLPPAVRPISEASAIRFDGAVAGDEAGKSVAKIGDVNDDAIPDYAISAPYASNNGRQRSGTVYIVYGAAGASGSIDLGALPADRGYRIDGATAEDFAGWDVSAAGDVNGDEIPDVVVGAPGADGTVRTPISNGAAFVIFGRPPGQNSRIDLAALENQGFKISGPTRLGLPGAATSVDTFGSSVAGLDPSLVGESTSDVNDDGLDDIVVGAGDQATGGAPEAGAAFVIYGRASAAAVDATNLGTDGFKITGVGSGDHAGASVALAGDVDNDGAMDIAVTAPGHNAPSVSAGGAVYIVSGGSGDVTLDAPAVLSVTGADGQGLSDVSSMGDVDGDGTNDLAIGGNGAFLVHTYGLSGSVSTVAPQVQRLAPSSDSGPMKVSRIADANGDLIDDWLVGSSNPTTGTGRAWLVYSDPAPVPRVLDNFGGERGIRFDGPTGDAFGAAVAGVDGGTAASSSDSLVGSPQANPRGRAGAGAAYVIQGAPQTHCYDHAPPTFVEDDTSFICSDFDETQIPGPEPIEDPDDGPATASARASDPRPSKSRDVQCKEVSDFKCHFVGEQYYGYYKNGFAETVGLVKASADVFLKGPNTVSSKVALAWAQDESGPNPFIRQDLRITSRMDRIDVADIETGASEVAFLAPRYNTDRVRYPIKKEYAVSGRYYPIDTETERGHYIRFDIRWYALGYPNVVTRDHIKATIDNGRFRIPEGKSVNSPRFNCSTSEDQCRWR
ncbi:integrin alpha [Patulibacter sp. NPDC049589]|uniref:integrin alpha n=1 Tax=Patulibacter sp. NPDC049589 TaxID=3154731 RepID=UPI0034460B8E